MGFASTAPARRLTCVVMMSATSAAEKASTRSRLAGVSFVGRDRTPAKVLACSIPSSPSSVGLRVLRSDLTIAVDMPRYGGRRNRHVSHEFRFAGAYARTNVCGRASSRRRCVGPQLRVPLPRSSTRARRERRPPDPYLNERRASARVTAQRHPARVSIPLVARCHQGLVAPPRRGRIAATPVRPIFPSVPQSPDVLGGGNSHVRHLSFPTRRTAR